MIENKYKKQIIKALLFSIVLIILLLIGFKNLKIKKIESENVKISLSKKERSNYPKTESLWAILEIKSIKINSYIYRGEDSLINHGILHHKESYFPGDGGTILLAASNTYLKELSNIKTNDEIKIKTLYGNYKYKVDKKEIKDNEELSSELKITNKKEELIIYTTLTDNTDNRFVVYASIVGENKWNT